MATCGLRLFHGRLFGEATRGMVTYDYCTNNFERNKFKSFMIMH